METTYNLGKQISNYPAAVTARRLTGVRDLEVLPLRLTFSIFLRKHWNSYFMADTKILCRHTLAHIPNLTVAENIFSSRFANACSMNNCKGNCCKYGVWADVEESKNILEHADLIRQYMEPHQEQDPQRWFEDHTVIDKDFPSGFAIGTQIRETGCVFLDSKGRCVLQSAAMEEGMDRFALKPFFCVAYPISIEDGVLLFDDEEYIGNPQCCSPVPSGNLNVFDICSEELEFTIGTEGLKEVRELAASMTRNGRQTPI